MTLNQLSKPLEHLVKIYVPSTETNKKAEKSKVQQQVNNTLTFLSQQFGGSTSQKALGYWLDSKNKLVKESVELCFAYCQDAELKESEASLIEHCQKIKADFQQEAVALEIDNKLYFV